MLDPVIHAQARLRIMATLAALAKGDELSFPRTWQIGRASCRERV